MCLQASLSWLTAFEISPHSKFRLPCARRASKSTVSVVVSAEIDASDGTDVSVKMDLKIDKMHDGLKDIQNHFRS